MSLDPVASAPARLSASLPRQVGFAAPFLLGENECFFEKILLAVNVFGDGIGTVGSATEPRPLLRA